MICFTSLAFPWDKKFMSCLVFPLTPLFCLSFYYPLLSLCPAYSLELNVSIWLYLTDSAVLDSEIFGLFCCFPCFLSKGIALCMVTQCFCRDISVYSGVFMFIKVSEWKVCAPFHIYFLIMMNPTLWDQYLKKSSLLWKWAFPALWRVLVCCGWHTGVFCQFRDPCSGHWVL